jgi:hypothetical protein
MDYKFTIGCDPEVFVTKRGKPASAYGILEGTKQSPKKTNGGAYQVDGMAAEFNTDPVGLVNRYGTRMNNLFQNWDHLIVSQIEQIKQVLPAGHSLKAVPVMEFGKEFLDKQPDAAKELGCDPDYNAYTLKENPRPDGEKTFRTGAGHIHIGWGADIPPLNEEHMEICASFVKMMDATVGMLMTVIDRDPKRRDLYGKAGAFRPKTYGTEYRTPSNVWIRNRDTRKAIWDLTQHAIWAMTKGKTATNICGFGSNKVEEIINTGDVDRAKQALDRVYETIYNREYYWRIYPGRPGYVSRIIRKADKEAEQAREVATNA